MSMETNKEEYVVMFEEVRLCEICNNEVTDSDNFCNICGAKVEFNKLKPYSRKNVNEMPIVYDGFYFSEADCLYSQHYNTDNLSVIKCGQIIQLYLLYQIDNIDCSMLKTKDGKYGSMPLDQFRLLFTYMPNYNPDEELNEN